jgi:hypothetical protein
METINDNVFACKECNLSYVTRTGLWKHNKKYHEENVSKCNIKRLKNQDASEKRLEKVNILEEIPDKTKKKEYICKKCKRKFNNRKTKWSHEQTCEDKNKEEEFELLKKSFDEMKKELCELKKEKNISKNISKNINNGSINNGKIINNININAPGHELMTLTKEDIENIFETKLLSVITYIEKTNFNKNKKYNHNFCTTNQNGKYLSYYDQESSTIKTTKKKYFYHDMISNGIIKIKTSFNKFKNKIKKGKQDEILEIITRLEQLKDCDFNNKMLKGLIDELNLLSYNSRKVVLDTWNIDENNINDATEKDNDYNKYFINIESTKATCNELQKKESLNSDDSDSDDESISVKKELIFGKKLNRKSSSSSSDSSDIEV